MKNKLIRVSTVAGSMNLLAGQLKYYSKDYEVTAVASGSDKLGEVGEREGVRTHEIKMARDVSLWQDIKSLVSMVTFLAKEKPFIVHSITPKAGLISMVAAWLTGVPIRIHTYTGLIFPTASGFKQKVLIAMEKLQCFCATRIIPEGQGVKRDLEVYHITKKPLKVILNGSIKGLDEKKFDPALFTEEQKKELREKLGLTHDDFVFVFVGRLNRDKGINELVQAFRQLSQVRSSKLLLVGPFENDQNPVLTETAREISENPNIFAVGPQKDVRPFYAISDALVFPSYREGFPNVPQEAGAMNLPSIVTDINGSNEIIIEGQNGTIVPPRDTQSLQKAMQRFLDEPSFVASLAQNARKMITSRYNPQAIWDATLGVYKEEEAKLKRK